VTDAAAPRAPYAAALGLLFAALSGPARLRIAAMVVQLNKHPAAAPLLSWTPFALWLVAAVLSAALANAAGRRVRALR